MIIRKAKLAEVNKIGDMALQLLLHHQKLDTIWTPSKDARARYRKLMKKSIHSNKSLLLVAEDEKGIIGFARAELKKYPPVFHEKKYGFVSDVYVEKAYRRKGVGKLFLDEIFAYFKEKKMPYAELSVAAKNTMGHNAWKKYGFKDVMIYQRKTL